MCLEINNPKDYNAALYIRLSREDDNEKESESVANQKSLLLGFTQKQGLYVYDIYIDDGFSGTNFDRPSFQRLLDDIGDKKVNMVITKDMSRLGRDYIQTGYYLERYFPENRIRYISLLDGIDTGIESSINDITPFKAIMNDMYAKDISKKIRSVKDDKRKKGLFIGGKASYGYVKSPVEKNKIVIDKVTACIVNDIFNMALDGKSGREIARILTARNIPTPACYANMKLYKESPFSHVWKAEKVVFMLRNQIYIGNMVQGRVKKISYKSEKAIKLPGDQWTVVHGTHEPIIEKEVFDRVQIMLDKKKKTRIRTYDYLLNGLIYCHECGHKLGVMNRVLSGNKDVLYLFCRTYQRFTYYKKCTLHNMRVDIVTEKVSKTVREVCRKHIDAEKMVSIAEQEIGKAKEVKQNEDTGYIMETVSARIENLTMNLDEVYSDKLSGTLSEDDFIRIYTRIKEERALLQEQLVRMKEDISDDEKGGGMHALRLVSEFIDTVDTNKELLFGMIDRIEITKKRNILIYFRFRNINHLS